MLEEEGAPPVDEEKEVLERTRKLQTEIEEHMKEEQNNACQHEEVTWRGCSWLVQKEKKEEAWGRRNQEEEKEEGACIEWIFAQNVEQGWL